jgi:putative phosphoribosyl transferase
MFGQGHTFRDRRDAGRQLARALSRYRGSDPLVLALPRGGVPVAFEVATALRASLDVLIVRKIGAPGHEEFGLGAVVDGSDPQVVLNEEAMQIVNPPPGYVEAETRRQLHEIERRRRAYVGDRQPAATRNRTVIVVDDGIATGGTVLTAVKALRRTEPRKLVLAVPLAPRDTLTALQSEADDIVCLAAPEPFYAVGMHYRQFGQTSDEEVIQLLERARTLIPLGH